jgi:glutaredoxin
MHRQLTLVCCAVALMGCHGKEKAKGDAEPNSPTLAPLVLRDDTRDIMLTWVDATGDFHVVEAVDQVPADARERVRVVTTTQAVSSADQVYVADLRQKTANGTYPTSVLPRSTWEETGAARRKARMEALAPVPSAETPPEPSAQSAQQDSSRVVVIYGAEWCGACREAERYLKRKGVKVLEKDVDQSPAVQAELRSKLAKAGMSPTSSIPIIDIGGRLLVGFSQSAVDAALKAAFH